MQYYFTCLCLASSIFLHQSINECNAEKSKNDDILGYNESQCLDEYTQIGFDFSNPKFSIYPIPFPSEYILATEYFPFMLNATFIYPTCIGFSCLWLDSANSGDLRLASFKIPCSNLSYDEKYVSVTCKTYGISTVSILSFIEPLRSNISKVRIECNAGSINLHSSISFSFSEFLSNVVVKDCANEINDDIKVQAINYTYNSPGVLSCSDKKKFLYLNETLIESKNTTCLRSAKWKHEDDLICKSDIDECINSSDVCSANAICINTIGSFLCECKKGFTGIGNNCTDIDECINSFEACSANATCINTNGSFWCECKKGFTGTDNNCTDLDECSDGSNSCSENAFCKNLGGTYECKCEPGYTGDGIICEATNMLTNLTAQCSTITCAPNAICMEVNRSPACVCMTNYSGDPYVACEAYCTSQSFRYDGVSYFFPETWSGQLANSEQICAYSGRAIASIPCNHFQFNVQSLSVVPCNETLEHFVATILNTSINENQYEEISFTLQLLTSSKGEFRDQTTTSLLRFFKDKESELAEISSLASLNTIIVLERIGNSLKDNGSLLSDVGSSFVETINSFVDKVKLPPDQELFNFQAVNITGVIVNTKFEEGKRGRVTRQVDDESFADFSGDIIVRKPGSNTTVRALHYVLPKKALDSAQNSHPDFTGQYSVLYFAESLFATDQTVSETVSISLGPDVNVSFLEDPVKIQYFNQPYRNGRIPSDRNPKIAIRTVLDCRFWDFSLNAWSSAGCGLNQSEFPPLCQCDHLTNFALLVARTSVPSNIALEITSLIGCVFSIVGLAMAILLHLFNRDRSKQTTTKIFLHICLNLMVGYIIFIVGIDEVSNGAICTVIAALLQYFFLATWCWMCAYSLVLYLSLVKVFYSTDKKTIFVRACLFAYGVPLIITGLNVASTVGYLDTLNTTVTSDEETLFAKSFYKADYMCWIHDKSLYYGFLLPVGVMLLVNIIFFCILLHKVIWKKQTISSTVSRKTATRRLMMSFTLFVSMGLTWIFGYIMLISTEPTYFSIFSWIFVLTNTTQGVLMFFVACKQQNVGIKSFQKQLRRIISRIESIFRGVVGRSTPKPSGFTSKSSQLSTEETQAVSSSKTIATPL